MSLPAEKLYEVLEASNNLVAKVLKVSELAQIAKSEIRLREFLYLKWIFFSKKAIKKAVELAEQGKTAKQITKAVNKIMEQWSPSVISVFEKETKKSFKLAMEVGHKKATKKIKGNLTYDIAPFQPVKKAEPGLDVDFHFDLKDAAAIDGLTEHQLFWVGEHYQTNVSNSVGKTVEASIAQAGKDTKEAGKLIKQNLTKTLGEIKIPKGFHGTSSQYFEALAANTTTVARSHGVMRSFSKVGIKRYQITNPVDERTCEKCSHLDGKEFTVVQGSEQMHTELSASSKKEVKEAHPWLTEKELKAISPKPGFIEDPKARAIDSKNLADKGQALPPFHFRCRCGIDVSDSVETYEDLIPMIPPTATVPAKPVS